MKIRGVLMMGDFSSLEGDARHQRGRPLRFVLLIALGFWSLVSAIAVGNGILRSNMIPRDENCPDWIISGLSNVPFFFFWALLTPLLWWLIQRRPKGAVFRQFLYLAAFGVLIGLVSHVFKILSKELVIHAGLPDHEIVPYILSFDGFHKDFLVYGGTCMALLAWDYYSKFRERKLHAAELESSLAKSRLHALQMQIHPHFLFNALNTISALVERNPKETRRVVARLSELIRSSLDFGEEGWISVEDEVAFLQKYLEIERVRFGKRLSVKWAIEAAAGQAKIPPFLIQPLVENAVRHGVSQITGPGKIEVWAGCLEDVLEIRVRDNGPGCKLEDGRPQEGIGLSNVAGRLRQLYGERGHLTFSRPETGGFEARLQLPFQKAHEPVEVAEALPN